MSVLCVLAVIFYLPIHVRAMEIVNAELIYA